MFLLLLTDDAKKGSQYYQRVSCARCAAARAVSFPPTRISRGHRHLCFCLWFYCALYSDDDEFAFLFGAAVDIVVAALDFPPLYPFCFPVVAAARPP